jgi:hypothetical protein
VIELREEKRIAVPAGPGIERTLEAHGTATACAPHAPVASAGQASTASPQVMMRKPPFGLERRTA